jgi:Protein of unknown function (DUF551)
VTQELVIPDDLKLWFLRRLAASVNDTWGPSILDIPQNMSFYASYSKKQIMALSNDPRQWTYWKGIQDFPVNLTVAELMQLMLEREAALEQQLANARKEAWISVKDRLPELNKEALVTGFLYDNPENERFFEVGTFTGTGFRQENAESGGLMDVDLYATHWQPLPEPPLIAKETQK